MRTCLKILLLLQIPIFSMAQQSRLDSLKNGLKTASTDSARYLILTDFLDYYLETKRDSALNYADRALSITKKYNQALDEASTLEKKGYVLQRLEKFPESFQCFQQAIKLAGDSENENKTWKHDKNSTPHKIRLDVLADSHHHFGHLMEATTNTDQAIYQFKNAKSLAIESGDKGLVGVLNMDIGNEYLLLNRLDSASALEKSAESILEQTRYKKYLTYVYERLGYIYLRKGQDDLALQCFHKGVNAGIEQRTFEGAGDGYSDLFYYYFFKKQKDSSLYYAKEHLKILLFMGSKDMGTAYENLYQSYKLSKNIDSAYKYQGLALTTKDSSDNATTKSLADFQKLSFKEQLHLQDLEKEQEAAQTRTRTYAMLAAIGVLMLLAGIFYRNNRQKQKANKVLESTLANLKTTQTQLIQSEKMASLGELTAGIAHEIQNPLNFVNNFSEVNQEMIGELEEELNAGNMEEVLAIIADIKQNEQKINHHGKRADGIVKGMLEHSRTGSGDKQLINMNALADEFMRLSYHGLRAKDKSFNAEMVTNFDPDLPKVLAVGQDIGRVFLNLFNNAFYAVNLKKKTADAGYAAEITVSTYSEKGRVIIKVKDNGIGMPDHVKEKIMQPFFTTKPTGEGTGLGLSLTYDMVVKGHGGSILVNSVEGEGSEFIIQLPVN
jgi:two-component system NtrC family sensor kinase